MLRFAILKQIGKREEKVVLEYNAEQILRRLQSRVEENLAVKKIFKVYNKKTIKESIAKAFLDLVTEFKEKTITLR